MAIIITLGDDLTAELESRARKKRLTAEQLALAILTEAMEGADAPTPEEVVARVQATGPNLSMIRPAQGNLADFLLTGKDDPNFDLETWQRQWAAVEAEQKAVRRANDIAEGRGE